MLSLMFLRRLASTPFCAQSQFRPLCASTDVADFALIVAKIAVGPLALALGPVVLVAKVGLDKVVAELRGDAEALGGRIGRLRAGVGAEQLVLREVHAGELAGHVSELS